MRTLDSATEPTLPVYNRAMRLCSPIVQRWSRLEVSGLDSLPISGPVLLAANHDSYWDPVVVGVAALGRRQIRALAKSSLWRSKPLARVLDGMGQIPVTRGAGDTGAVDRAAAELRAGACVGIFPEATLSRGQQLRARSGIGRLAVAVPEAQIVGCVIEGTTDIIRFPRRPKVSVRFFDVSTPRPSNDDDAAEFATDLLAEIRSHAPPAVAGRRPHRLAESQA